MRIVGVVLCVVLNLAFSYDLVAQNSPPVTPVFEQNSVDGLLLGAEGSYKLFGWLEPSLGLAYGLESQKIRYKAGLGLWDLTLLALDWPGTPVLGRVGQTGLQANFKLWDTSVTAFTGALWDKNPQQAPSVAYLSWGSRRTFSLPFGIEFSVSTRQLHGVDLVAVALERMETTFQSSQTNLRLSREGLSLNFSYGNLENPAKLPDFEFVQGVKGEAASIKGDRFWALRFERRFELIAVPLRLPTLPIIDKPLLESILVEGAAFVQVSATMTTPGDVQPQKIEPQRLENLLSWGLSFIISLDGLKLRADIVFKRDGEYRLLFGS